jgi:AcrR family transcriptional regulator
MARKPARRKSGDSAAPAATRVPPAGTPRERIVAAFMALLAEKRFEQISFADIAETANVSLADLRDEFNSTVAIFAAHVKEIDRKVLAGGDEDMAEESARERLFDVLMRRLDLMAPHRAALRSLMRSAMRNPPLAFAVNRVAVRSHQWMLTAAGIRASGPQGMIQAQGLALLFGRVLRTFVDDDDDNARTMAELDRALTSGQRWAGILDDVCRLAARPGRRRRRRRDDDDEAYAA